MEIEIMLFSNIKVMYNHGFVIQSGSGQNYGYVPGRLTDGPYTSYDLNTLLKATAGERWTVLIGQGDKLVGEASRIIVAEACIQALDLEVTKNQVYEVNSVEFDLDYGNRSHMKILHDFDPLIFTIDQETGAVVRVLELMLRSGKNYSKVRTPNN
ncbi:hypothetical protein Ahy_A09g045907 [Arachis hypogaea]|uniref:Uncharacterized protein n=1 Tax=Arachis hypogaea TaxID=3818 RepID=A0A445BNE3_ARAHY|nr:hypothetical protein Ahy_A09g045907 [Arachis hypogaea]